MTIILGKAELETLTGYKNSADIAKCLRKHKIFHVEGKDGQVSTTNIWLEQAGTDQGGFNDDGFNAEF